MKRMLTATWLQDVFDMWRADPRYSRLIRSAADRVGLTITAAPSEADKKIVPVRFPHDYYLQLQEAAAVDEELGAAAATPELATVGLVASFETVGGVAAPVLAPDIMVLEARMCDPESELDESEVAFVSSEEDPSDFEAHDSNELDSAEERGVAALHARAGPRRGCLPDCLCEHEAHSDGRMDPRARACICLSKHGQCGVLCSCRCQYKCV